MKPMPLIAKPGPRKQELLNKFSWLRTFLLVADKVGHLIELPPVDLNAAINFAFDYRNTYLMEDDDEYNYNHALETYQRIENSLMEAGIDVEAGVRAAMKRNGYTNFSQMKPAPVRPEIPDDFFEIEKLKPAGVGSIDPWN